MKPKNVIHFCEACGSLRVQGECWVELNTDKVVDESGDDYWCNRCQDHVRIGGVLRVDDGRTWLVWDRTGDTEPLPLRDKIRQLRDGKRPTL